MKDNGFSSVCAVRLAGFKSNPENWYQSKITFRMRTVLLPYSLILPCFAQALRFYCFHGVTRENCPCNSSGNRHGRADLQRRKPNWTLRFGTVFLKNVLIPLARLTGFSSAGRTPAWNAHPVAPPSPAPFDRRFFSCSKARKKRTWQGIATPSTPTVIPQSSRQPIYESSPSQIRACSFPLSAPYVAYLPENPYRLTLFLAGRSGWSFSNSLKEFHAQLFRSLLRLSTRMRDFITSLWNLPCPEMLSVIPQYWS